MPKEAHLVLEDGTVYRGHAFGTNAKPYVISSEVEKSKAPHGRGHGPIPCVHHEERHQNAVHRRNQ